MRMLKGNTGPSRQFRRHPRRPLGSQLSRARHPRKERRTTLPSRLAVSLFPFKSCTWPEGEAGPGRHSPTFSFPVSVQGSFFSFLYSLPLPAPPSLSPFPPSLPSRLDRSAGVPDPLTVETRRTPSRSRLSGAWSLPSPSLPPSPTPDAGSARRPEEPRGEHLLSALLF